MMKAMAMDLIKGKIDQENQCLIATWVQSRRLDVSQVSFLRDRIEKWNANVNTATRTILQGSADWVAST